MSESKLPMWQLWAQFRFSVIGELLSCSPSRGQLQKAIERLAGQHYQHPTDPDRRVSFGKSTIERWYYKAKTAQDPVAVLGRKIRRDAGIRWSMPDHMLASLKAQYEKHPRWNIQLHYDNLQALCREQLDLGPGPGYKTVLRCMHDNGWVRYNAPARPTPGQHKAIKRSEQREVRSFEVRHVHGLWHLDFHFAKIKILDSAGKWHQRLPLLLMNRCRPCCASGLRTTPQPDCPRATFPRRR